MFVLFNETYLNVRLSLTTHTHTHIYIYTYIYIYIYMCVCVCVCVCAVGRSLSPFFPFLIFYTFCQFSLIASYLFYVCDSLFSYFFSLLCISLFNIPVFLLSLSRTVLSYYSHVVSNLHPLWDVDHWRCQKRDDTSKFRSCKYLDGNNFLNFMLLSSRKARTWHIPAIFI